MTTASLALLLLLAQTPDGGTPASTAPVPTVRTSAPDAGAPGEAASRARMAPLLFGGEGRTWLLLPPLDPGAPLTVVTLRLRHPEMREARTWDDATYRFVPNGVDLATLRTGKPRALSGTVWRFGADDPGGRVAATAVAAQVTGAATVAPVPGRGIAYRAFGTPSRLFLVHAGSFVQLLRVTLATDASVPEAGLPVRLDRPELPATRLLPGETAQGRLGENHVLRMTGAAEVFFADAPAR